MRRISPRLLIALVLFLSSRTALAATIAVAPGPGTPLQDAIDGAAPGDTIRLAAGGYPESITITKPLRLSGPRGSHLDDKPPAATIAAGCTGVATGITVAADDVKLSDLRVITFTEYGIDVQGRHRVGIRNVLAMPNCSSEPPLATINVVASTRVKIDGSWAIGFSVPGTAIRLSAIPENGKVRVRRSLGGDHDIGILIEDSAPGSVLVTGSYANYGIGTGILLRNSDGIVLTRNRVVANANNGIELDATSDGNRIIGNVVRENATDVVDAGTGNCWTNNSFATGSVPPCP